MLVFYLKELKMNFKLFLFIALSTLFLLSCTSDQVEDDNGGLVVGELTISNLSFSVDRDIVNGTEIGTIQASGNSGDVVFQVVSQSSPDALIIDEQLGTVTISDVSSLTNTGTPQITATVSISDDVNEAEVGIEVFAFNIWSGVDLVFSKANGADPAAESNQDRITENVWITRGNQGGQIYNARLESSWDKANSPIGTRWALGNTMQIHSLTFAKFRDAVSPKDVVGKELVLYLETDDVYLDVVFTSWSEGRLGGFGYTRSTADQ